MMKTAISAVSLTVALQVGWIGFYLRYFYKEYSTVNRDLLCSIDLSEIVDVYRWLILTF